MPMNRDVLCHMHKALCDSALELMRRKNEDYASKDDPFRNFRAFGALGILVRLSDKIARLQSILENAGSCAIAEETIKDTVLDGINYFVLYYGFLVVTERYKDKEPTQ